MKNQLSKDYKFQELLFERIKQEVPAQISMVETISELLNISNDAAYRRLRSEKKLDIDELFLLCNHFHISADSILRMETDQLAFQYSQLDLNNLDCYLQYMKSFSDRVAKLATSPDSEIRFAAIDIPVFHFMPFQELTLFKIFTWTNSIYEYRGSFEDFIAQIRTEELFACYQKIATDYGKIPSIEVWTEQTIDTTIRLLDYYFETGFFSNKETPFLLANQLLQMIENLQNWVEAGGKGKGNAKFSFYLSEIDLENNFVILRNREQITSLIKLFTINSIATSHKGFGEETLRWIDNAIRRSVLLTGASEKVRIKFFQNTRNKVNVLLRKFEQS